MTTDNIYQLVEKQLQSAVETTDISEELLTI